MPEARMDDFGSGLAPVTDGWFVVNVKDAEWWTFDGRGARCPFESEYPPAGTAPPVEFAQLGINITVLRPGEAGLYHGESDQEGFLVLSGECTLIVEEQERLLRAWDFFHAPAWTDHVIVGAGDGPSVLLMTGARSKDAQVRYPVSALAARHGASVAEATSDWRQAYANARPAERRRPPYWDELPWAEAAR
jgi:uncharacterized cupin superfamily protein